MKNTHNTGESTMNRTRNNPSRIVLSALAAFGVTALSAQAAVVLPTEGNSVNFEAEDWDAESGASKKGPLQLKVFGATIDVSNEYVGPPVTP